MPLILMIGLVMLVTSAGYYSIVFPARQLLETIAVFAFPGSLCASLMLFDLPDPWPIVIANIMGVVAIFGLLWAGRRHGLSNGVVLVLAYAILSAVTALPLLLRLFW